MGFRRNLLILPLLVISQAIAVPAIRERLAVRIPHQLNPATPAPLIAEGIKDVPHHDANVNETPSSINTLTPTTTTTTTTNDDGITEGRSTTSELFNLKPNTHYVISSTDLQILLNQIDSRTKQSQPTIIVINTPAPQIIYQGPPPPLSSLADPFADHSYEIDPTHPDDDGLTNPQDLRQGGFSIRKSNRDIVRRRKQRRKVAAFYKRRGNILRRQHRIRAQNRRRRGQIRRKNQRLQSNFLIQRRKIKHLNNVQRARLKRRQAEVAAYNRQVYYG